MKKSMLLLVLLLWLSAQIHAQENEALQAVLMFQKELNAKFADKEKSPLTKKGLRKFDGLDFFPIDTNYIIKAHLVRIDNPKSINLKGGDPRHNYSIYGLAIFDWPNGQADTLHVYQSERLRSIEYYKDHLFLPFTDLSNGAESYGGGRFIDLLVPEKEWLLIDFNRAYNPYCAYNSGYSCPIPPPENHIDRELHVGVKAYDGE